MTGTETEKRLIDLRSPGMLAMALMIGACSKEAPKAAAIEPIAETACALDGMVLNDYPGPKAQIHYAEGAPEFFCDLTELFAVALAPEQKRPVAGMFVQDMGKADWTQPRGHWMAANAAFYVVGSGKHGSMGPTFGSFSSMQDAEAFVAKEGGKVLKFEQITLDMLSLRTGATHDNSMH